MSSVRAAQGEPKADELPAQSPEPAAVYRLVADLVRQVSPTACNLRLVYDVPQPSGAALVGTIPLPSVPPKLTELAADMLTALKQVDGWINGAALAKLIDPNLDLDHTGGTFKRAVDELKAFDLIDTDRRKGYSLK